MVSITIESATVQELLQEAARLLGSTATLPAGGVQHTGQDANAKPLKRERADKKAVEEPKAEGKVETNGTTDATPFTAVSEMVSTLVSKAGKPATVKLLGEFQVKRASELKPEQYGSFLADARKLLA